MEIGEKLSGYCVLNIHNNVMYAAQGYKLFKSYDAGKSWEVDGEIEDFKYGFVANISRLVSRLLRTEITTLLVLQDGSRVAIGKKGIFCAKKDDTRYKKTFQVTRGNRPMNICEDKNGFLYFGEYFSNPNRDEVHIYKSMDSGNTWKVCYTFPKNTIRHIHGIFYDKFEDRIWFATGDLDKECIIGNTKDMFETINIVKQGKQIYRAVQLLFYRECIIYGTDTEYETNYIYRLDRKDYKEHCLQKIQGSVLASVNATSGYNTAIATAVEPSQVNDSHYAYIWFSRNGLDWEEIYKGEKDSLHPRYFQYGRFKFPINGINSKELLATGHALKNHDNSTVAILFT